VFWLTLVLTSVFFIDKFTFSVYSFAIVMTIDDWRRIHMTRSQLSSDDEKLIQELYAKRILQEGAYTGNLSNTLVITDAECPNPQVSLDVETPAAYVIANLGGALLLQSQEDSLYSGAENASDGLRQQLRQLIHEVDQVILVACVPSWAAAEADFSVVQIIDGLIQVKSALSQDYRHLPTLAFLFVRFSDRRACTYQIDPLKFRFWYEEYEQNVLGRQGGLADDDED
jgi:hypothetical protein